MKTPAWLTVLLLAYAPSAAPGDAFRELAVEDALAAAREAGKLVFIDFFTTWCGPCKVQGRTTWTDPHVTCWLGEHTVPIRVDADREPELAARYSITAYPTLLFVDSNGKERARIVGYRDPEAFLSAAAGALEGRSSESPRGDGDGSDGFPFERASRLVKEGRFSEAVDAGLRAFQELGSDPLAAVAGRTFWFELLVKEAKEPARLREAARDRAAAAEQRLIGGTATDSDAADLAALRIALDEADRAVAVFDRLPEVGEGAHAARAALARSLVDALIAAKRYDDVLAAVEPARRHVARRVRRVSAVLEVFPPPRMFGLSDRMREAAVDDGVRYYEALVGAGDVAEGRRVAALLVELHPEPFTFRRLARHAVAAGNPHEARHALESGYRQLAAEDHAALERVERRLPPAARTARAATAVRRPRGAAHAAWSVAGPWSGVAAFRGEPHVLLAGEDGRCERLDPAGETVETLPLRSGAGDRLRLFRGPVREPIALTFSIWSSDLRAFDADGGELWRHPRKDGIDDVWPVDLDGDGIDEVVVGHNGGSGLCVLGHDGEHLWSRTDVGNVWHVCGGALGSAEQGLVVSTSAAGDVHLFTRDSRVDIDVPFYASMVRVVDEGEPDGPLVLVAGRSGDAGIELAALAPDGTPRWSDALPVLEDAFVDSAAVAPAKGWCAVGLRGGLVHVVDVPTGALLATLEDQGGRPEVAWLHRAGAQDPLLVVATGEAANAFRIVARE